VRIVCFNHSVAADWNHGNAHFLRGLMDALARRGHETVSAEPVGGWSLRNLVEDAGAEPIVRFARTFPDIAIETYDPDGADLPDRLAELVRGAELVLVHEWTEGRVVAELGRLRSAQGGVFLYHDTHHRAVSQPDVMGALPLGGFDGVLAFGDSLRRVYQRRDDVRQAWTLHEAADVPHFHPLDRPDDCDVVWIGNWGDDERSDELRDYWVDSARALPDLRWLAYGTRYPADALREIEAAGIRFGGWAPSLEVPELFARARLTLHIPRRLYVERLPGIPTIRIFEALACGVPLICTPWRDAEALFRPGDYATVDSPAAMRDAIRRLAADEDARMRQAERGLETILARHTCDHRANELLEIHAGLGRAGAGGAARADSIEVRG